MATQQNNTMAEGLTKIVKDIAVMKMQPDADMEFLGALEGDIYAYLKPPVPQPAQADPMGGMGSAMGQVMGGVGAGMPNPDENRRMLTR